MFVGLDIGSTHIKAVGLDEDGRWITQFQVANPAIRCGDEGLCLTPEAILERSVRCLRSVLEQARGRRVHALGITGMAEAGFPLDANGCALYPAIPWSDTRAQPYVKAQSRDAWNLYRCTGQISHPKYPYFRFQWLREHRPCVLSDMRAWVSVPGYIGHCLTGRVAMDETQAVRTMLLDPQTRKWLPDLARECVGGTAFLPEVLPQGSLLGHITKTAADCLDIPGGTPVILAGQDHLVAREALSVPPNDLLDSSGTAEAMVGRIDALQRSDSAYRAGLNQGCCKDGFYWMSTLLSSGGAVEWLRRMIGESGGDSSYETLTALCPSGPGSLRLYPYFSGSGSPHIDPMRRGAMLGIEQEHGLADLLRAIYEGVAFELRWTLERVAEVFFPVQRIWLTGGASESVPWLSIRASVLGTLCLPKLPQAAACGAAKLAAAAVGMPMEVRYELEHCAPPEDASEYEAAYIAYRAGFDQIFGG